VPGQRLEQRDAALGQACAVGSFGRGFQLQQDMGARVGRTCLRYCASDAGGEVCRDARLRRKGALVQPYLVGRSGAPLCLDG
jgi:hypothetical protein